MQIPPQDQFSCYFDPRFGREAIKILPGQYFVTSEDKLIVTVLGSCVAACIFDPVTRMGGMNHFLLPSNIYTKTADTAIAKYGQEAMFLLIDSLVKSGACEDNLQAKVFGGGQVLPGFNSNDVGTMNANFVQQYLDERAIPILSQDLLNDYARKVYFFPTTGDVFMKRIRDLHNDTILQRERDHTQRLTHQLGSRVV